MSKTVRSTALAGVLWLMANFVPNAAAQPVAPPLSIADTLAFRQIRAVHMAPSGNEVAYVVRRALLERKANEDTLALVGADGEGNRTLLTAAHVEHVQWDRAGRHLFALVEREHSRALMRIDALSGGIEELWKTEESVDHFTISPDGTLAVVATLVRSDPTLVQQRIDSGFVYEYGRHMVSDIIERDYAAVEAVQLQVLDIPGKSVQRLARLPFDGFESLGYVRSASVSPDNRKLAMIVIRQGEPTRGGAPFDHDLMVLDLRTGISAEPVPDAVLTTEGAPVWLADSGRLFFVSSGQARVYDPGRKALSTLEWVEDLPSFLSGESSRYDAKREHIYIPSNRGLHRLSLREKKIAHTPGSFDEVSFSSGFEAYAFVSESSNEWPEVAVHDVRTARTRRLTNLNAWLAGHALGRVEELTVSNAAGVESKAYLMYPVGYEPGRRYPLILATYGFRGRFPIVAEWHTTFPAQTLAGKGYAVLMLNRPSPGAQSLPGDPVKARDLEGWQMLSTFENAVQLMIERGIADPERLGIYGWSHGGFIVEFLLAHSKLRFAAAALGEGGDYKPGGYWYFGGKSWPRIYENIYGGPLSERTLQAYLEFSPGLRFDRFESPLLLEFAGATHYGLETYVNLRELGKPAELVIYDGEEHNFVRPATRFASMHRKVDWFDFWLKGEEDADQHKAGQYARWRKLREQHESNRVKAKPDDVREQGEQGRL